MGAKTPSKPASNPRYIFLHDRFRDLWVNHYQLRCLPLGRLVPRLVVDFPSFSLALRDEILTLLHSILTNILPNPEECETQRQYNNCQTNQGMQVHIQTLSFS
jgi:hypothetical protein